MLPSGGSKLIFWSADDIEVYYSTSDFRVLKGRSLRADTLDLSYLGLLTGEARECRATSWAA